MKIADNLLARLTGKHLSSAVRQLIGGYDDNLIRLEPDEDKRPPRLEDA